MKSRKNFILSLLLIIGLFGTLISEAMALGLDEVRIKTPKEGQLLRSTEVRVQVAARQAVDCEYTVGAFDDIGDEDPDSTDSDDVSFDAPVREGAVKNNKLTIDYAEFFPDETEDTEREIRRGDLLIKIFETREYLLDITCFTEEGDAVNREVRFLIKPPRVVEID